MMKETCFSLLILWIITSSTYSMPKNIRYLFTDVIHEDLTFYSIDYVHMNSLAVDYDSNLVISSRSLSEVTKIDRETGDIIWRFGGENNQFQLIDDPYRISYQHHVRPVSGKPNHYTIFDNGNYHTPKFSRAVEYKVDPVNGTAENVWEFHCDPDRYTHMMGDVQRLSNVDYYNVYGDTHSNPTTLLTISHETNVFLADLENNTDWYFRITAVDKSGTEGGYSNEEQITTSFIEPSNVKSKETPYPIIIMQRSVSHISHRKRSTSPTNSICNTPPILPPVSCSTADNPMVIFIK